MYEPIQHFNINNAPSILLVNGLLDTPTLISATREYYTKIKDLYERFGRKEHIEIKEFEGAGHEVNEEMIIYAINWLKNKSN